jgi:hypothetical protein
MALPVVTAAAAATVDSLPCQTLEVEEEVVERVAALLVVVDLE